MGVSVAAAALGAAALAGAALAGGSLKCGGGAGSGCAVGFGYGTVVWQAGVPDQVGCRCRDHRLIHGYRVVESATRS